MGNDGLGRSTISGKDAGKRYHWCLRHKQVEVGDDVCPVKHRLGPFRTRAEAEQALETVRERNEEWEAEDERWHGSRD